MYLAIASPTSFLQEVGSLDGDLLLVGTGAAKFPLGADQ
jgi:hypothetical protein